MRVSAKIALREETVAQCETWQAIFTFAGVFILLAYPSPEGQIAAQLF